jgi:hypothetical protein
MDDVGDDLNHIVLLLLSVERYPNPISEKAVQVYTEYRPHCYGSYLKAYYEQFGSDTKDFEGRVKSGVARGWAPDVSAPYGAIRWYHRATTGGNPQLATLYSVILDKLLK